MHVWSITPLARGSPADSPTPGQKEPGPSRCHRPAAWDQPPQEQPGSARRRFPRRTPSEPTMRCGAASPRRPISSRTEMASSMTRSGVGPQIPEMVFRNRHALARQADRERVNERGFRTLEHLVQAFEGSGCSPVSTPSHSLRRHCQVDGPMRLIHGSTSRMADTMDSVFQSTSLSAASDTTGETFSCLQRRTATMGLR